MRALSHRCGRALSAVVVGGAFVWAAGCGGDNERFPPVAGAVATTDGKPVPSGNVTFYPDASKGNKSMQQPTGVIEGGRYELFVPGGRKGAPPGWYKVVVYAVDDPQPGKPNKYFTHKKYTDVAATPLLIEVVEKPEPGRYDLKLDR